MGDGNDIIGQIIGNEVRLVYSHGTGDCPSGCTYRKNWEFYVYDDCTVSFEGESYNSPELLVMSTKLRLEGIRIYPNPVTSHLFIEGPEIQLQGLRFSIYTLMGQKITEGIVSTNQSIDLSSLAKGNYLLQLQDKDETYSHRLVKR